jgi:hypothetical protein
VSGCAGGAAKNANSGRLKTQLHVFGFEVLASLAAWRLNIRCEDIDQDLIHLVGLFAVPRSAKHDLACSESVMPFAAPHDRLWLVIAFALPRRFACAVQVDMMAPCLPTIGKSECNGFEWRSISSSPAST